MAKWVLPDNTVPNDAIVEATARIAHAVNRAYCAATGDYSQVAWEDAPEWQKESAIAGVRFLAETPEATPADTHNSWVELKLANGWRHGPVKDESAKLHPCIAPYEDLPITQRTKDHIYLAVVRSALIELKKDI